MRKYIKSLLAVGVLASGLSAEIYRNSSTQVVYDTDTNLMWQDNTDMDAFKGVGINWEKAKEYCKNHTGTGYDGWGLPSYEQMKTIVDYNHGQDIIDGFEWRMLDPYWTSSEFPNSPIKSAIAVDFKVGRSQTGGYLKTNNFFVRCVRTAKSSDPMVISVKKLQAEERERSYQIAEQKRIEAEKIAEQNRIENERKQKDSNAYNKASSANTIASYKEYLANYPNGDYASSAKVA